MSLFHKPMCGSTIPPACAWCAFAQPAADPRMILCRKRGAVSPEYHCYSYQYDPLLRVPKRQPRLPDFTPQDFSLDD